MVKRALIFPLCANSPRNVKSGPEFGARQWSGLLISAHFVMKFRFPVFWHVCWWGPSPTSLFALTLTVRSRTRGQQLLSANWWLSDTVTEVSPADKLYCPGKCGSGWPAWTAQEEDTRNRIIQTRARARASPAMYSTAVSTDRASSGPCTSQDAPTSLR